MHNKRGSTLELLPFFVAAVIVTVIVIIGFSRGWENFLPWLFKANNVDAVVRECNLACTSENVYGFCTQERALKAPELAAVGVKGTCDSFSKGQDSTGNSIKDKGGEEITQTELAKYNLASCPSISCA